MRTIYIARHGQDEDNANGLLNGRRDTPLTPTGEEQARKLAANIRGAHVEINRVYCSPLQRAHRTADIICDTLGLPKPVVLPSLVERDFGVMTGEPHSKIVPMCAPDIISTATITYFLHPQGAESFPSLLDRARKLLNELKDGTDGSLLLVTHGDFGKMIYAAYYGLNWREVLQSFHFGNSDLLALSADGAPHMAHVYVSEQHNL